MPLNIPKISIDESATPGLSSNADAGLAPPQPRQRRHSFSLFGSSETAASTDAPASTLLGAITNNPFLKRSMERLSNFDPDNDTTEAEPHIQISPRLARKSMNQEKTELANQSGPKIETPSFLQGQQRGGLLGQAGGSSALAGTNFAGANVTQDAINSLNKKKFSTNELGRWSNIK